MCIGARGGLTRLIIVVCQQGVMDRPRLRRYTSGNQRRMPRSPE